MNRKNAFPPKKSRSWLLPWTAFLVLLLVPVAMAQETGTPPPPETAPAVVPAEPPPVPPAPPTDVKVADKPSDEGKKILLQWTPSADDSNGRKNVTGYEILRATSASGPFEVTEIQVVAGATQAEDMVLADDTDYWYVVRALTLDGFSDSAPAGPVQASPQWFKKPLTVVAVFTIVYCGIFFFVLWSVRRGVQFYIRPIAGINAIDEAIGRATEMGKPILFVPGLLEAGDAPTVAALSILGRVAKKVAEHQCRVIVPAYYPMVMVVAQEVVKNAYLQAGRPQDFHERDVFYLTNEQFAYTAAVNGIMLRERPATNFYLGGFYAESLVLAETGFMAGSIQIAGTSELIQIPFFVAACDYTLIGEELYAAAAYLSDDPKQKVTLKAQDYGKAIVMAIILAGAVLASLGFTFFTNLFAINL